MVYRESPEVREINVVKYCFVHVQFTIYSTYPTPSMTENCNRYSPILFFSVLFIIFRLKYNIIFQKQN